VVIGIVNNCLIISIALCNNEVAVGLGLKCPCLSQTQVWG